jgi:alpha-1,6-mannosyltransferase
MNFGRGFTWPSPVRETAAVRVLDITEWFGETSGGVRTYLNEKTAYVADRPDFAQVLVVPGQEDSVSEQPGMRCYRLRGPHIPTQKPYRFMLATRSIRRIIESERPSVIEVGSCFAVPWIVKRAARASGIPLVGFFHGNLARTVCPFPERASAVKRRVYETTWKYMRAVYARCDVTVCASEFAATDLATHGVERVAVVPLGVDLAHFHPRRKDVACETRERLGLPTDRRLMAFIGRFAREKEIDVLLDAWPSIEQRTDAGLVLVGDGHQRQQVDALARRSDRVYRLPYQGDREALADLLAAVDVVVSPGSAETFGLCALESLASGTPVLAADRGGVAEQLTKSGAGAMFTAGDPDALASAALDLLDRDDLHLLGFQGRSYAEREHEWSVTFDRLFACYREVAEAA